MKSEYEIQSRDHYMKDWDVPLVVHSLREARKALADHKSKFQTERHRIVKVTRKVIAAK